MVLISSLRSSVVVSLSRSEAVRGLGAIRAEPPIV
jgi:hypothetical protein